NSCFYTEVKILLAKLQNIQSSKLIIYYPPTELNLESQNPLVCRKPVVSTAVYFAVVVKIYKINQQFLALSTTETARVPVPFRSSTLRPNHRISFVQRI
uniref:Uncharacterized protein n=1 Tax=Ciona savignyi TaxID=51511 RepID=H2YEX2_CIOSA